MKRNTGITLIILVFTIVLMLILVGAIILSLDDNINTPDHAREVAFKEQVRNYQEQLQDYIGMIQAENSGRLDMSKINLSGMELSEALPGVKEVDKTKYEVVEGKLVYVGEDEEEIEFAKGIIEVTTPSVYIQDRLQLDLDGIKKYQNLTDDNYMTWEDGTKNNNDGLLQGSFAKTDWTENGLKFGQGKWVDVENDTNLMGENMTISVVFTANSFVPSANYYSCFVTRNNGWGYNDNYNLNLRYDGKLRYRVGTGTGDNGFYVSGNTTITLNKTHSYMTRMQYNSENNQTTVKIYLDGNLENKYSFTGKPLVKDDDNFHTNLGEYVSGSQGFAQYLDGTIHSVRIYDRALSDEEIEYNYKIDKQRFNIEE